jgi:hypothetical protein
MEMRLLIAYGLIALLIAGISTVVVVLRKKHKRRRGDYR